MTPTTRGPRCHRPSLLGHGRWTSGVKGGGSSAHAALHLKTPLRRLKDESTSTTTNSPKSCSDGKGAKTAGGRCHWKPQSQSCMQAVQDIGRLMLTWRRQHHSAAPWMTKQPSLGIALLAPNGEGPRKGGLNKAHLFHTQLACRSQRASSHAAEIQLKRKNVHLLRRRHGSTWHLRHDWTLHVGTSGPCLTHRIATAQSVALPLLHTNCHGWTLTLLLSAKFVSQRRVVSKSKVLDIPSTGQADQLGRDVFQVLASWSGTPLPPSWKLYQPVTLTALSPCTFHWAMTSMSHCSVSTHQLCKQTPLKKTSFIPIYVVSCRTPLLMIKW